MSSMTLQDSKGNIVTRTVGPIPHARAIEGLQFSTMDITSK